MTAGWPKYHETPLRAGCVHAFHRDNVVRLIVLSLKKGAQTNRQDNETVVAVALSAGAFRLGRFDETHDHHDVGEAVPGLPAEPAQIRIRGFPTNTMPSF